MFVLFNVLRKLIIFLIRRPELQVYFLVCCVFHLQERTFTAAMLVEALESGQKRICSVADLLSQNNNHKLLLWQQQLLLLCPVLHTTSLEVCQTLLTFSQGCSMQNCP